jgi:hypothetical protein
MERGSYQCKKCSVIQFMNDICVFDGTKMSGFNLSDMAKMDRLFEWEEATTTKRNNARNKFDTNNVQNYIELNDMEENGDSNSYEEEDESLFSYSGVDNNNDSVNNIVQQTIIEILNKVEMNIMTEYNQNIFENGAVETKQKALKPIIVKDVQRIIQNSRTSFDFK